MTYRFIFVFASLVGKRKSIVERAAHSLLQKKLKRKNRLNPRKRNQTTKRMRMKTVICPNTN